ncbi:hypothetical protein GCM10011490_05380 [Pseudoclavibacter endophyticus]|uniref:Uncharacterized protein n=1 Tax=Pseudoclavibacter endophyticus TaxID=1778590 RepID=A0A6H9WGB4_9MICO|nr:hypothetical protein [Pseudoclavibacter endophyticus]KAB1649962.1 hypothetical protein F8O04_06990 [Pseudoclavibacter endophyticus]GGA58379.1 hypothetical protein GCM10011490_05380 [Pseudoclavibacter endophyticus]
MPPNTLVRRRVLASAVALGVAAAIAAPVAIPEAASAATTGALTITDESSSPDRYVPENLPAKYPSVEAVDPNSNPQAFWDGGEFTFPADLAPARGDTYPMAIGGVNAPTDPICTSGGTVDLTLSFDVELMGPTAGVGGTADASFVLDGTTRVGTSTGLPPYNTPLGWSGTVTTTATVPVEQLVDGRLTYYVALEGFHNGSRSWDASGLTLDYSLACPPVAEDDETSTYVDESVQLDPLANDSTDPSTTLDPSSVRFLDESGNPVDTLLTEQGEYSVDTATGVVTFAPAEGFTGLTDAVTYQVANSDGLLATALITIDVLPFSPAMTLVKDGELDDANENGLADVGETITYTFTVENTGTVPLTEVSIADAKVSGIQPSSQSVPVNGIATFTASYVVTQADVDSGSVYNEASASGTDPRGGTVATDTADNEVPGTDRVPGLTVDKSSTLHDTNENGLADVGETIDYSFLVTNTGNVTLHDVTVEDPKVGEIVPASVTLGPDDQHTFTASYTVASEDVSLGEVYNTASVSAIDPINEDGERYVGVPDFDRVETVPPAALLTLEKTGALTGDVDGDGLADLGDVVTYTFAVHNAGNVDVADVRINDPRVSSTMPESMDIAVGGTGTFTADYTVTQDDVDAGEVANTATAEGAYVTPEGPVSVNSSPSTDTVGADRAPALEVVKDGVLDDTNENGLADVGETISYTITAHNRGNTTLVDVVVFDERVDGLQPVSATIPVGESVEFVAAPYTVTQADVDAGSVTNTASARGRVPNGPEITSPPVDNVINVPAADPSLTIEKFADLQDANDNGTADVGEEILYSFDVVNTGNVTLSDVAVIDDRISALVPASIDTLAPGERFTFLADPYVVTEADVQSGGVVNVASATGMAPGADEPTESESDTVTTVTTVIVPPTTPPTPDAAGPDDDGSLVTTDGALGLAGLGALALAIGALITGGLLVRRNRVS